ncbi:MAG: hypothetical protein ACQEUI_07485 [Actinomycetota bacterium]
MTTAAAASHADADADHWQRPWTMDTAAAEGLGREPSVEPGTDTAHWQRPWTAAAPGTESGGSPASGVDAAVMAAADAAEPLTDRSGREPDPAAAPDAPDADAPDTAAPGATDRDATDRDDRRTEDVGTDDGGTDDGGTDHADSDDADSDGAMGTAGDDAAPEGDEAAPEGDEAARPEGPHEAAGPGSAAPAGEDQAPHWQQPWSSGNPRS